MADTLKKSVRIRLPLPQKDKLIENMTYVAKHSHDPGRTAQDELRIYIKCREEEIQQHNLEIQKSKKRIERLIECIKIAEDAIKEINRK